MLVWICFDYRIKIRVSGAFNSQLWVKVDENIQVAWVWCRNVKNIVLGWFWPILTLVNPWLTRGIWPEKAFWVLRHPNGLRHIKLDVFTTPSRKVNIFDIFGVLHANQGQKKYSICSCPFFIWHLDVKEWCWAKKVILHLLPQNCMRKLCCWWVKTGFS